MKDLSSTSFGYLIAFLLPGIFGLYALRFWVPQVEVLLLPIRNADASVGPSFIFLVVAIGVGVCISGLRYFIFEKGIYRKRCLSPIVYRGMGSEKLALVRAFADEHYRYHQFYGGCAVALLILFVGWLAHAHPTLSQIGYRSVGFILFGLLLERSADDAFTKYIEKCRGIEEQMKEEGRRR